MTTTKPNAHELATTYRMVIDEFVLAGNLEDLTDQKVLAILGEYPTERWLVIYLADRFRLTRRIVEQDLRSAEHNNKAAGLCDADFENYEFRDIVGEQTIRMRIGQNRGAYP